jgi:DNA-binding MarR family transcriptional regulator
MAESALGTSRSSQEEDHDVDAVTTAVLTASRLLVAISARSLAAVEERVTLPQFRMLVVLANAGEMKLIALAERLAVNPSTAMRMVDRLTTAGLTRRRINPDNRRETLLRLTPAGRQIVDDVTARRSDEIAAIVSRMPADQRGGLVTALRAFSEAGQEPSIEAMGRDAIPLGWD